jgi:ASC-1-like (ASCH) protein
MSKFGGQGNGHTNDNDNMASGGRKRAKTTPVNRPRPSRIFRVPSTLQFIDHILAGEKTVEGRVYERMFVNMRVGDEIEFFVYTRGSRRARCLITAAKVYLDFRAMLEAEGVRVCLPSAPSLDAAVEAYHKFNNFQAKAAKSGVVALRLHDPRCIMPF